MEHKIGRGLLLGGLLSRFAGFLQSSEESLTSSFASYSSSFFLLTNTRDKRRSERTHTYMQVAQIICAHGATISTTRATLQRAPQSLLATSPDATSDSDDKIVRILVEALRRSDMSIIVSESFDQWARLAVEVSLWAPRAVNGSFL